MKSVCHASRRTSTPSIAPWCAATIFLGAFLLFQVQPVVGKMILPWFGGTPAVWTTCMLFFQILLLAGYAYADLLSRWPSGSRSTGGLTASRSPNEDGPSGSRVTGGLTASRSPDEDRRSPSRQAILHLILLAAALLTLPITPGDGWKPADGSHPTWRILMLLSACVGLPYLLLSATSPLVQAWFARVHPDRSPYRLYALSNLGSLGALLSYPFVVEPALTTRQQGWLWSGAFVVFVAACAWLTQRMRRAIELAPAARHGEQSPVAPASPAPSWPDRVLWLLLPALASTMLLAVTNHLCQDVAVVPFLWIAPLSLYLLSFIICFDREAWYVRRWFALGAVLAILAVTYLAGWRQLQQLVLEQQWHWQLPGATLRTDVRVAIGLELTLLFLLCMVCHGEVVRRKPVAARLTSFYLTVAAGGALGGVLVAVVCPWLCSSFLEFPVSLVVGLAVCLSAFAADAWSRWLAGRSKFLQAEAVILGVAVLAFVVWAQWSSWDREGLVRGRNFYGVLSVRERFPNDPERRGLALYHGATQHGYQFLAERKRNLPTAYFVENSGVGRALRCLGRRGPLRVGVVGLGAGTLASYGRQGDVFRFYEINPLVIELAHEPFTFLRDSAARVDVVPGDARLSLEREDPQQFDLLVLDAFSGDSIPVHLLTREAMDVYRRHLRSASDGVIALHISNRYVDLVPIVAELARFNKLSAALLVQSELDEVVKLPSEWMLVTANRRFLQENEIREVARTPSALGRTPLWTDQYNNLFQALR